MWRVRPIFKALSSAGQSALERAGTRRVARVKGDRRCASGGRTATRKDSGRKGTRFTLSPMKKRIALFWPGDARAKPNELALPNITEATQQMERALKKLGREPYLVPGFLSKPHESIEKLGPI